MIQFMWRPKPGKTNLWAKVRIVVITRGGHTDWEEHKKEFLSVGDSLHLDQGSEYFVYTYIKVC